MDLKEIGCEDGRWMELARYRIQWRAFLLAVLNLWVLLPESQLISKWILGKQVVRMGDSWNWLRIISNGGLWYWQC
jgi:hypothetical protein